jgi:hypothetical protein
MAGCCVVAGLENKLEKPPVCVCGCDAGAAPSEGKGDVDAGFAAPREAPNRLPPKLPVLGGCDDGALEGPPPRLPNRLGVVPDDVLVPRAPNSGLAAGAPDVCAPPEAGWPPRFPKSDMVVVGVRLRRVDCAENKRSRSRFYGARS